jgi:hypothetical protein
MGFVVDEMQTGLIFSEYFIFLSAERSIRIYDLGPVQWAQ